MSQEISDRILAAVQSENYRPQRARGLAKAMGLARDEDYNVFRTCIKALMTAGKLDHGANGTILLPSSAATASPTARAKPANRDEFLGTYRHNRRGFGFVVPKDPAITEDLFIPPGDNLGAMSGDIVRCKVTNRGMRAGKEMTNGRVTEVIERTNKRFVGSLAKIGQDWIVLPDGNTLTDAVRVPDAGSKHLRPGTKVVVELTKYPEKGEPPEGVISEVLGQIGERDVDLKSLIIQYGLPEDFPTEVKEEARRAVDLFEPKEERAHRLDISDRMVCTIDPDDAKDYDDAISLRQLDDGDWELGVHIADVSHFVKHESALDIEAKQRGNSTYFPGYVIPMLPEILSNGVCSLQEGVPRLCKSAFIVYDEDAKPVRASFANTIIKSAKRLRYTEAQDLIDNKFDIRHTEGSKRRGDYTPAVLKLLGEMNDLAKRLQARRKAQGQLNLDLPSVDLVLDEDGKVIDAKPEDDSFTHTLIEMFMVEANEAVARLLDGLGVPFLRRTHPTPEIDASEKLRHFAQVAGHKIPKVIDRHALQALLAAIKGKPEAFAVNLAVLKSLTRAEYSPEPIGHFALASEHYGHFTSPIRRYADLTIHRLLDAYFAAANADFSNGPLGRLRSGKVELRNIPSHGDLIELGRHISFTERRSEDAERELRQVKILTLMQNHIGDEFPGVVTGVTNFGVFIQLGAWLVDGLIKYEDLGDDWWEVDDKSGTVRGKRTGSTLRIGDPVRVRVVKVDLPRRQLDLVVIDMRKTPRPEGQQDDSPSKSRRPQQQGKHRKGNRPNSPNAQTTGTHVNAQRGRAPGRPGGGKSKKRR